MMSLLRTAAIAAIVSVVPAAFATTQNRPERLFLASAKSKQALAKLEAEAKSGNATAEDWLGLAYQSGFSAGMSRSYPMALKWFDKAAKKGCANAEFNLGQMYQVGAGVPRDFAEAKHWYRLAARKGSVEAKYSLNVISKLDQ